MKVRATGEEYRRVALGGLLVAGDDTPELLEPAHEPFNEDTAFGLLAEAGIAEERWAAIHEATRGLPFLLTLAIEEATAPEAESALFAKKFFDRTTRWMTPKEREWFAAVCYLDKNGPLEDQPEGAAPNPPPKRAPALYIHATHLPVFPQGWQAMFAYRRDDGEVVLRTSPLKSWTLKKI